MGEKNDGQTNNNKQRPQQQLRNLNREKIKRKTNKKCNEIRKQHKKKKKLNIKLSNYIETGERDKAGNDERFHNELQFCVASDCMAGVGVGWPVTRVHDTQIERRERARERKRKSGRDRERLKNAITFTSIGWADVGRIRAFGFVNNSSKIDQSQ